MIKVVVSRQMVGEESGMLFFFQAEDGIRDSPVTGVQTCALPIYTTESTPKLTFQQFLVEMEPYWSEADRLRMLTKGA